MSEIKSPKVSVILSAYNAQRFLPQAVESILNQTFTDFELFLIDDGSTDRTAEIIKVFSSTDNRVRPIYKDTNKGPKGMIKTLNEIIDKKVRGEYIARMDADDISLDMRLEKQVRFLDENPKISIVGTGAINVDSQEKVLSYYKPITSSKALARTLPTRNLIYNPSVMFRKEVNVRYRDIFPCEDYDFFLQALKKGYVLSNIPDLLLKYRVLDNSHSHRDLYKTLIHSLIVQDVYWGRVSGSKMNDSKIFERYHPEKCEKSILERSIVLARDTFQHSLVLKLSDLYKKRFGRSLKVGFSRLVSSVILSLRGAS